MTRLEFLRGLVITLPLAACVAAPIESAPAIPPVPPERIPSPPEANVTLIWQPGHWDWDGQQYRWSEGRWVPRSGHGPLWQDGFWRREGRTFVWVPAHWL